MFVCVGILCTYESSIDCIIIMNSQSARTLMNERTYLYNIHTYTHSLSIHINTYKHSLTYSDRHTDARTFTYVYSHYLTSASRIFFNILLFIFFSLFFLFMIEVVATAPPQSRQQQQRMKMTTTSKASQKVLVLSYSCFLD